MDEYLNEMLTAIDQDLDLLSSTYKNDPIIYTVFKYVFDKDTIFNLPKSEIIYKKYNFKDGLAPRKLKYELNSLNIFLRKDLDEKKHIQLYVSLLESLSVNDILILECIRNKSLKKLYPRLTKKNIEYYGHKFN
jgi:hypothetical protein